MFSIEELRLLVDATNKGGVRMLLTESTYYRLSLLLHFDRGITFIEYTIEPKFEGLPGYFITREYPSAISRYERTTQTIQRWLDSGGTIEQLVDANDTFL